MPGDRFFQLIFGDRTDVVGPGDAIFAQAGFASAQ